MLLAPNTARVNTAKNKGKAKIFTEPNGSLMLQKKPNNLAIKKAIADQSREDANGKQNMIPRNLKRTSQGKRPTQSFSSIGKSG